MSNLELITTVAFTVVVICVFAAYVWTVILSSEDDDGVPPVSHWSNASRGPPEGPSRVAAPLTGDVDRATHNPSGTDQIRKLRERADILEPASQDRSRDGG
jgi:hypothetical protein